MDKIWLVIKREYLTRVKKRSFIVMTILTPILMAGLIVGLVAIQINDEGQSKTIGVIDESGFFINKFQDTESINYRYLSKSIDQGKSDYGKDNNDALLYIPKIDIYNPSGIQLYGDRNPHFGVTAKIENTLEKEIRDLKIREAGIGEEVTDELNTKIDIRTINLTETGERSSSVEMTIGISYVSSLLIYFFLFLYGVQVMKGVMEEKTNRIIEVIISSIKPFQLMMGKILGIAAVGLTQFLLWALLSTGISTIVIQVMNLNKADTVEMVAQSEGIDVPEIPEGSSNVVMETLMELPYIGFVFVLYFLGGYFLYAALFATVGSAVDSDSDSQQFMFPVTIPLIISIIALQFVLQDPDGSIAVWMSMIPLSSPIVMMGRIPFDPPVWQVIVSLLLLVGGFIFTTWLAARIYRVGILMHGTKVNYRTLAKWFFMKN
ncbi:MAG: ABC transporter permease [Cyclobacteriaceae bacterium]